MQSNRKMYTRKQLVFFCVLTLAVFAGLGFAIRKTRLWGPLTSWLGPSDTRPTWQLASLSDPENAQDLQRAYARIHSTVGQELSQEEQDKRLRDFQSLKIWKDLKWQGVPAGSNPCDLWVIHQIIHDVRPDYIVETGTSFGGCALYYADLLEDLALDKSRVITIGEQADIQQASEHRLWKEHVEFVQGRSIDPALVARLEAKLKGKAVLVVLGSSHEEQHVLEELRLYGPLVSPGSYLVVRDTYVDGNPAGGGRARGPMSAVSAFLKTKPGAAFFPDTDREAMVLTFNRGGWLKRKE